MTDTSWLEINGSALRQNVDIWRRLLRGGDDDGPPARLCGVVKAEGYGLGGGEIGRALVEAGVDMLAVYCPAQADELLRHPVGCPILVLMPVRTKPQTPRLHRALARGQIHLAIDAPDQLLTVDAIGRSYRRRIPVHLALDTGMSRGGLCVEQFNDALRVMPKLTGVSLAGVWTHFAAADTDPMFTDQQLGRFERAIAANCRLIPTHVLLHAASTFAAIRHRRYHLDMVRIGLGLLGYAQSAAAADATFANAYSNHHAIERDDVDSAQTAIMPAITDDACDVETSTAIADLEPVVRWRGRIVHVRRYPRGACVGYGCTARLKRDSFLGIVPVGYADGYPLALSNRGVVRVITRDDAGGRDEHNGRNGRYVTAPVVGQVNMDQIIIDLTTTHRDTGVSAARAHVGETVELISDDPASPCALPKVARLAGSSCYELLCRLSPRLPRCYVSKQQPAAAFAATSHEYRAAAN